MFYGTNANFSCEDVFLLASYQVLQKLCFYVLLKLIYYFYNLDSPHYSSIIPRIRSNGVVLLLDI